MSQTLAVHPNRYAQRTSERAAVACREVRETTVGGPRRVAVVGGGVAGLTAAYALSFSAEVTLYEAEPRLGGHAHTHEIAEPSGGVVAVDTGFIVHNRRTYPTLVRLFDELGVATRDAEMSMSISCRGCGLVYTGGRGPGGLFPTPAAATRPRYLALLAEVGRFHRRARAALAGQDMRGDAETLGEFLRRHRFSRYFAHHFALPLVAAVWSCPAGTAARYPARYLFRFLDQHGMLSARRAPRWCTVVGGSARYVERIAKRLTAAHTATPVRAVIRDADGVSVRDDADQLSAFDAAVIATHSGQALTLLAAPTPLEASVLGAIAYQANPALLHTDASVLPAMPAARACWNYRLPSCDARSGPVRISYDLSRLQGLSGPRRFLLTVNDDGAVPAGAVLARMAYEHPVYTPDSVAARAELPTLNDGVLAFAGAYHGWGFHEDGARSGLAAAASLGGRW